MQLKTKCLKHLPELHRAGSTCANIDDERIILWGGTVEPCSSSKQISSLAELEMLEENYLNVWIFDTMSEVWTKQKCDYDWRSVTTTTTNSINKSTLKTFKLPAIIGSTSAVIGETMFVFGGHTPHKQHFITWLNDLYSLNLKTFIWSDLGSKALATPTKPIRSDKNCSWAFNNKYYVFGGYGWIQPEHYLDLLDKQRDLQLCPDSRWPVFGWNNQLVEYNVDEGAWNWPSYSGKCPSARAAHSGALVGHLYFVFGGRDANERLNDLYTLNMITMEWTSITTIATTTVAPVIRQQTNANNNTIYQHANSLLDASSSSSSSTSSSNATTQQETYPSNATQVESQSQLNSSPQQSAQSTTTTSTQVAAPPVGRQESHILEHSWSPQEGTNMHASTDGTSSSDANCDFERTLVLLYGNHDIDDSDDSDDDNHNHNHSHISQQSTLLRQNIQMDTSGSNSTISRLLNENSQTANNTLNQDQNQIHLSNNNENINLNSDDRNNNNNNNNNNNTQQQFIVVDKPIGRSFASFTPITSELIVLYGGICSKEVNLNDCWLLNIKTNTWTEVSLKHNTPRLWHAGMRGKENEVILLSGSSGDIDNFCTDAVILSLAPSSLLKLSLISISQSIKAKIIPKKYIDKLPLELKRRITFER